MIKIPSKPGIENFLNMKKKMYNKSRANIILNIKKLGVSSLKSEDKDIPSHYYYSTLYQSSS